MANNGIFASTTELQIINYLFAKNSYQCISLNGIDDNYFTTYKEQFNFVKDYYEKYNQLPSKDTFQAKFNDSFEWVEVTDPEDYLIDKLKEQKLYRDLIVDYKKLAQLIKDEKTPEAVELMASLSQQYLKSSSTKCVDLIDDAKQRYESFCEKADNPSQYYVTTGLPELDDILGGWDLKNEVAITAARTGMGKCHEKGTLVLMADGTKKAVENIKVGDKVQSINSVNTVLQTHNGVSKGYKIIPSNGEPFVVSENHILSLWKRNYKYSHRKAYTDKTGEIVDITIEDYLKLSKKQQSRYLIVKPSLEYSEKELSIPPYMLGLWLSYFTITDCLKNKAKPLFKEIKNIPLEYLTSSRQQRLELLAGLIDSVGTVNSDNGYGLTIKDMRLVEDIAQLSRGLGFKTVISDVVIDGIKNKIVSIFGSLCNIPTRHQTNISVTDNTQSKKDYTHCTFTVEPVDRVEYYGFACDGDHRFLLGDNTLSHNSWWLVYFALAACKTGLRVGYYSGEMEPDLVGYRLDTFNASLSNGALTHGNSSIRDAYATYIESLPTSINGHIYCATPDMFDGSVTVSKLRAFIEKYDLQMLIVDQISLLDDQKHARTPREQTVNISKDLHALQRLKKIPILSAVQLNREEDEKGPTTKNLSESDRLGQDATTVLFIERKDTNVIFTVGKARTAKTGDKLTYNWDINNGVLHYVPNEKDARKGAGSESVVEDLSDSTKSDNVF